MLAGISRAAELKFPASSVLGILTVKFYEWINNYKKNIATNAGNRLAFPCRFPLVFRAGASLKSPANFQIRKVHKPFILLQASSSNG
jgi:hypothetical protein